MGTTHRGVTRWELILLGTLVVSAGVLILPTFQHPSDSDWPEGLCRNNLHQLGFALHNYHERYGSFPPAIVRNNDGTPVHSWRTLLLPDVDETPLYSTYHFDESWNSPHNREVASDAKTLGRIAHCRLPSPTPPRVSQTDYLAVIGPHTAWRMDRAVSLDEITDGTDRTILLVEVANSDVDWFEPRDLEWDRLSFRLNDPAGLSPGSRHVEPKTWRHDAVPYVNVLLVDGSMHKLPIDTPPEAVKALLTIDGGETFDRPWLE